jgi:hypothetical protein
MGGFNKSLCDFTKSDLAKYEKKLKKLVKKPKYICKKCLRVSSDKDFLCKPNKI